jgi:hypothetical protein
VILPALLFLFLLDLAPDGQGVAGDGDVDVRILGRQRQRAVSGGSEEG